MDTDSHIDKYLKRIEVNRPTDGLTEEYLNKLHIGHLTHIPFETFDLIDFKQLNISPEYNFSRLVEEKRGGVCFNMNGLFAFILKNLKYNVELIPCGVYSTDTKDYLDGFSHAAICLTLNNGVKYLCDVGFLRNFLTPLFFRTDCIQFATNGFYRLTKMEDGLDYKLERGYLNEDENISLPPSSSPQTHIIDTNPNRFKWVTSYKFPVNFAEKSVKIEDFQGTCPYIIHSPDVPLNHCTFCILYTYKPVTGAYGIIGKEYWEWIIENGIETRKHYSIANIDDNELKKLLKEKFDLTIERKIHLIGESE
jgi:arylamine N-acetyltransferase